MRVFQATCNLQCLKEDAAENANAGELLFIEPKDELKKGLFCLPVILRY